MSEHMYDQKTYNLHKFLHPATNWIYKIILLVDVTKKYAYNQGVVSM